MLHKFLSSIICLIYLSTLLSIVNCNSPVLIKTGKKGKDKMILISGGKCGSPTLIKGGKKGKSEMILVGGSNDCEQKHSVQVMKQFIPVPYYIPRPVYKYIMRHHYVPVRQVVVKHVPVPYPVKAYDHNNYAQTSKGAYPSQYGNSGSASQNHDYNVSPAYGSGQDNYYGAYSKSMTNSMGATSYNSDNNQDYYPAAGSQQSQYSAQPDAYYGGTSVNKDYEGVYKSSYDSMDQTYVSSSTPLPTHNKSKSSSKNYLKQYGSMKNNPTHSNYINYGSDQYAKDDYGANVSPAQASSSHLSYPSSLSDSVSASSVASPSPYTYASSATSFPLSETEQSLTYSTTTAPTYSSYSSFGMPQKSSSQASASSSLTSSASAPQSLFSAPYQMSASEQQPKWKRVDQRNNKKKKY